MLIFAGEPFRAQGEEGHLAMAGGFSAGLLGGLSGMVLRLRGRQAGNDQGVPERSTGSEILDHLVGAL
jgi:hypothetical protein